jgi:hypothetical protein
MKRQSWLCQLICKTGFATLRAKLRISSKTPFPFKKGNFVKNTSPFEKGGSRGIYLKNLPGPSFSKRGGE